MLIKCPQCQTVYRLESEKLPENGLKMRCAKCRCVWRAYNDAVKEEEKEKTSADAPSFDTDAFRFAFSREEKEERTPPDDRQEATAAGMPEDILSRPRQQKKYRRFCLPCSRQPPSPPSAGISAHKSNDCRKSPASDRTDHCPAAAKSRSAAAKDRRISPTTGRRLPRTGTEPEN